MMFVSNGKKSWIRKDTECKLMRNGSFIDVFYIKNGKRKWISLLEDDIKKIIGTEGYDAEITGLVRFDERIKY